MQSEGNISAALLSLLWPGLGQLAQGRLVMGVIFLSWSVIGAGMFAFGSQTRGFQIALAFEMLVVAVWAIVDAYRLPRTPIDRVTC